jgi:hypothetical protein
VAAADLVTLDGATHAMITTHAAPVAEALAGVASA